MDRKAKLRVLNKLLDSGYDDERKVMDFGISDMLVCDIRGDEIGIVLEFQKAAKKHSVIAYLGADDRVSNEGGNVNEREQNGIF